MSTQALQAIAGNLPYTLSFSQTEDRTADIAFYTERAADIAAFITSHRDMLASYIDFCEENGFLPDETAYTESEHICTQMETLLTSFKRHIADTPQEAGHPYYRHINLLERSYRALLTLKVPAVRILSWVSPAYNQSQETYHFQPSQYGGLDERFNYDRSEGVDLERWRQQMCAALNLGAGYNIIPLASGTAAFTFIYTYLLNNAFKPGFTFYLPRTPYCETDLLLSSDSPLYKLITTELHDEAAIAAHVGQTQPDAMLVEGLTNGEGCNLIHIPTLVSHLNALQLTKPLHLIVDDTVLAGAYNVASFVTNPHIKVYQYISGKHLQLGMDIGLSGALVVTDDQLREFQNLATWQGLVFYDNISLLFPQFNRHQFMQRHLRQTRNGLAMASIIQQKLQNTQAQIDYPLLPNHPHHTKALQLPFIGPLISISLPQESNLLLNKDLKSFASATTRIIASARKLGLNVICGESFSLSSPRISVNWCKRTRPFLRISAGDRSLEETTAIANCIAEELLRALPSQQAA